MLRTLYTILFLLSLTIPGFTQSQFNAQIPQLGDNPELYSAVQTANNSSLTRLLYNYHQGVGLLYDTSSTLTVGAGEVSCNSNTGGSVGENVLFRQNTSSVNATTANLDTGNSFSNSTEYYVYADCDASATTFTVVLSLNSTTPSGVTNYKLLGDFVTDANGNIAQLSNNNTDHLQSVYNYASSTSSYTYVNSGLKIAYGTVSIGASSSATITNLPFTSSTSFQCLVSNANGGTTQDENPSCNPASGSSVTIYNRWPSGTSQIVWLMVGV